jgi:type IV secretory pathway VirJ component
MLHLGSSKDIYNVPAELKKTNTKHVTCIFGEEEDSGQLKLFKESGALIKLLPGKHHYNNDFDSIVHEITDTLR